MTDVPFPIVMAHRSSFLDELEEASARTLLVLDVERWKRQLNVTNTQTKKKKTERGERIL